MEEKTGFFYRAVIVLVVLFLMPIGMFVEAFRAANESLVTVIGILEGRYISSVIVESAEKKIEKWTKKVEEVKKDKDTFGDI